ncbi:MAG: hypothetical protein WD716_09420 [Fimbriimonadaceae bacterium]
MNRRKKLWIACAAVGALALVCVVVLVVLALTYNPRPYRFLEGATYTGIYIEVFETEPNEAHLDYRIIDSPEAVAARMDSELTKDAGWSRRKDGEFYFYVRGDISVAMGPMNFADEVPGPGPVEIVIQRPATPIDNVYEAFKPANQ